jgi:hypothetical protein
MLLLHSCRHEDKQSWFSETLSAPSMVAAGLNVEVTLAKWSGFNVTFLVD